jgi:hypothetical protein
MRFQKLGYIRHVQTIYINIYSKYKQDIIGNCSTIMIITNTSEKNAQSTPFKHGCLKNAQKKKKKKGLDTRAVGLCPK